MYDGSRAIVSDDDTVNDELQDSLLISEAGFC
jgi:hypothetical protein